MADLLSSAQHALIRAAIQDVSDTFMDTTIVYHKAGTTVDDSMEDFSMQTYTDVNLKGLPEYQMNELDKLRLSPYGVADIAEMKVTFGFDDLVTAGIASGNVLLMNPAKDFLTVNGIRYKVIHAATEGFFTATPVLGIVYAQKEEKTA
jgi:hypothetical protein